MKRYISKLWYLLTYRLIRPKMLVTQAFFSGDESFIDVRYWLSRPDKIDPKSNPYLLTASGQKLVLMHFTKLGVIKSKMQKHTNTGIMLFYNKNHTVNKGDRVKLYWNGMMTENIEIL
jgi:hypothetical protein